MRCCFLQILANAVVKVVIPTERYCNSFLLLNIFVTSKVELVMCVVLSRLGSIVEL